MRRPDPNTPFSTTQKSLQEDVLYLLPADLRKLLLSQVYFILRRPYRYLQTLFYLLSRSHPSIKARLKTIFHFGEGVYAAYLLRRRPFRELHAHFVDRAATVSLVIGRLLNKPYSLSIHAGADIFVNPVLLAEKIDNARSVVTCTRFNMTHIESLVGPDLTQKITHIYHGLELDKYQPSVANSRKTKDRNRPLILGVGQLAERKGFHHLIQACRRLKQQGYRFDCRIIGQGPQRQNLQELIDTYSLQDTVFLCGALPHNDVIDWYRRATCFVLPCIQSQKGNLDGIPNVLAEAMAMQLPVVSTTVSAIPELIQHEENGLLVPPGDVVALSAAISTLFDQPERCKRLSKNARQHVLDAFDVVCNVNHFAATLWPDWTN